MRNIYKSTQEAYIICNTPVLIQLVGEGVDHLFAGQLLKEGYVPVLGTDKLQKG